MRWFTPDLNDGSTIFVFGSNRAGRHGKGAAAEAAHHWGAEYGIGEGRQGQSYAIPTKDSLLKVLTLTVISEHVDTFLDYATAHPELRFLVTDIGCGLAGYSPQFIAPMFLGCPRNCVLTDNFKAVLR